MKHAFQVMVLALAQACCAQQPSAKTALPFDPVAYPAGKFEVSQNDYPPTTSILASWKTVLPNNSSQSYGF
jgi:hypothetical protein